MMQTDWINSNPVFYNTKTHKTSYNMLDVVDGYEFDNEGLYDYLNFGYQVFEQTAIKNVRKLPHSAEIDEKYNLRYYYSDPIDKYIGKTSSVDEAIEILKNHIQTFEKSNNDKLLLLLSGGYDSRFLAHFIKDKSRLEAFTCDISIGNKNSHEVMRAKEVCKRLGITWNFMDASTYFDRFYTQETFDNFGLEVNSGAGISFNMMQMIIYQTKMLMGDNIKSPGVILHGSVGDWWRTQKVKITPPRNYMDFNSLFFNHGSGIPHEFIKIKTNHENKKFEFDQNIKRLKEDELFRIVYARRGRIGCSSLGMRIIEKYFKAYTPFYDIDVAMSQLNLPEKDRWGSWAKDYFKKVGLDVDNIRASRDWGQDLRVAYYSLSMDDLLKEENFKGIIDLNRIWWINSQLARIKKIPVPLIGKTSNVLFNLGIGRYFDYAYKLLIRNKDIMKALGEWNVLKPVEYFMEKKNARF